MRPRGRRSGGQATVELALVLPLILGLLLFVAQVGLVLRDQLLVVHAAREAARAAAVSPSHATARTAAVGSTSLDPTRMRVTIETRSSAHGETVEVTVGYSSPTGLPVVGALIGDVDLSETVTMRLESP